MNIKSIAREAQVSVATVSRVLNHPETVAPETRKKIEKIMKEAEYKPNWFARGLNFNKTGTIGLMIPNILNPVHMETAKGVEDVAHQKGYTTFMCNVENDTEKERTYLEQLIERRVDGIILICSCMSEEDLNLAREKEIPVVLVSGEKYPLKLNMVSTNNELGAKRAIEHLLQIGYKRIAFLRGDAHGVENQYKEQGCRQALEEAGIPLPQEYLMNIENSIEGGYLGAKKLIELKTPPQAIFCTADMLAFGAMEAIKDKGLNIPRDMALVGYDNVRMASLVEPKLTTVEVPLHKMGVYGARLLFDIIEGEETQEPKTILLQTKMKIRKSCGHKERIGEMF